MLRLLIRSAVATVVAAPFALTLATAAPAAATAFSVTDTSDDVTVVGTLRWAVAQADADATAPVIDIAPGLVINLTCMGGGALEYDNPGGLPLTINGNGAGIHQTCAGEPVLRADDNLIINDAVLTGGTGGGVIGDADVTLYRVVVEGNTGGAGVAAYTGSLTVLASIVQGNSGGIGGGIAGVFVVVQSSTISGNSASTGAGVWSDQTATITNSTITGNTATGSGGGVLTTNSDATFTYSTVVDNAAPTGANLAMLTAGNLTSFASVFAGPIGGANCSLNPGVGKGTQSSNFASDPSCGLEVGLGDPMLGALAENGGPTPTRLPAATSPLIDYADCEGSPIFDDQRATTRPQGGACDVGAVEVEVVPPAPPEAEPTPATPEDESTPAIPEAEPVPRRRRKHQPVPVGVAPTAAGTSVAGADNPDELPATGAQSDLLLLVIGLALCAAGTTMTIATTGFRHRCRWGGVGKRVMDDDDLAAPVRTGAASRGVVDEC